MTGSGNSFYQRLTDTVGQLESGSSAEVVVVAAAQSGNYRDIDHLVAFVSSLLCLLYLIHSPTEFDTDWFVLWVALAYLAALTFVQRFPGLRYRLTSRKRRYSQVQNQARSTFVEERVGSTRDRSGILVYVSEMEREAIFITDLGVDAHLPRAIFNTIQQKLQGARSRRSFQEGLLEQMATLAEPLAQYLPARDDDTDELDNQVRVRT